MPKSLNVLPTRLSERGELTFPAIPLYRYQNPLADELQQRGQQSLVSVLRHMLLIREFETLLNSLRSKGEYRDVSCVYRGPAHLSVGQEAAAVGTALALTPDDHIFGNHRSHGDFLAKGLAAIEQSSENQLGEIMQAHADGRLLRAVQQQSAAGASVRELAERFLLFGFLSEILMKSTGFNGGMGGSMHAFFLPFGAYPNNAIVGGSAGIATGSGLHKHGSESISVSISGDGSTGCGQVFEAMNFAGMSQYHELWDEQQNGGLPVLFLFNNNFYAMGGQTIGETMAWDRLSRIAGGMMPDAMHAETVDGTNPLAVAEAVSRQRQRLLAGDGPALLDIECYRQSGHSTSDANAYRSRDEIKAWAEHDAIARYAETLQAADLVSTGEVELMHAEVAENLTQVLRLTTDAEHAPAVDIHAQPTLIGELMFNHGSNTAAERQYVSVGENAAQLSVEDSRCTRVRQNRKKSRSGEDADGKPLSPMRAITLRDALFEAVLHHMLLDDSLLIYGEECREWGGAFGVYRGLSDVFPHSRVFNSPISEATIVATAVGYAMEGGRALVELMYADFIGRAGDEIFNQLSKWQAMSNGALSLPVVLRCSVGSKYGAQHSQDWTSLVAHIPGLKVVYPATPYDAKGLLSAALASNDPVVCFESQRLYDRTELHYDGGVPESYYEIELGKPAVKRGGSDLTLLTIGPCLYPALEAAEWLQQNAVEAEVIDARSLVPFDYEMVLDSVQRTGHIMIISEACERGSFAMTLASTITRLAFKHLQQAPRVLGAPNWIVPGAEMEDTYFVSAQDIIDVVASEWELVNAEGFGTELGPRMRASDIARLSRDGI